MDAADVWALILGGIGTVFGVIGSVLGWWNSRELRQVAHAEKLTLVESEEEALRQRIIYMRNLLDEPLIQMQHLVAVSDRAGKPDEVRRKGLEVVQSFIRVLDEGADGIERLRADRAPRRISVAELEEQRRVFLLCRARIDALVPGLEQAAGDLSPAIKLVGKLDGRNP